MRKLDILENLCMHDKRNPEYYDGGNSADTKSLDDECECCECLSGRKVLALVLLKTINCHSCKHWKLTYQRHECGLSYIEKCIDKRRWELK